jgi:hypothetical protein
MNRPLPIFCCCNVNLGDGAFPRIETDWLTENNTTLFIVGDTLFGRRNIVTSQNKRYSHLSEQERQSRFVLPCPHIVQANSITSKIILFLFELELLEMTQLEYNEPFGGLTRSDV